ncbi:MAG: AmmeMemoRadiSam system protein A [Verrucomicrobiota bacterium]
MMKKVLGFVLVVLLGFIPWTGMAAGVATNASQQPADTSETNEETNMRISEHRSGAWTPELTNEEKATLFVIAKDTLAWCTRGKKGPFPIESYTITPKLKVNTATFVTLKIHGDLRGCIGSLTPVEPLFLSVHHNAVNAAMHDHRFSPVQNAELPDITVDVSILSPIRDIPNPDAFKLGQHGIILGLGPARAVFLPEVAIEQSWTKEETLAHLSQKAGLSADAWRAGAQFQVFESVVLTMAK